MGRSQLSAVLGVWLFVGCGGEDQPALERRSDAVIYGVDGRQEVYMHPDPVLRRYAREAAIVLVDKHRIDDRHPGNQHLGGYLLGERYPLCKGERFGKQRTPGYCSATLIAPDLALTAGHCVLRGHACGGIALVFHHYYRAPGQLMGIRRQDVYDCKRLLVYSASDDYAVIQLDREVSPDHVPVPVGSKIAVNKPASVIGFPLGLPAKIAAGGRIQEDYGNFAFTATLDSFAGNSGSGVYDAEHRLVGVLVAGLKDWILDKEHRCYRSNRLGDNPSTSQLAIKFSWVQAALCASDYRGPLCSETPSEGDGDAGTVGAGWHVGSSTSAGGSGGVGSEGSGVGTEVHRGWSDGSTGCNHSRTDPRGSPRSLLGLALVALISRRRPRGHRPGSRRSP